MIVGLILHKQFCPLKIPQILSSHLTFNFLSSLRVPIKPLLFLKIFQFAPFTDPSPKKNEFFFSFFFATWTTNYCDAWQLPVFLCLLGDFSRELSWISRDSGFFLPPSLSKECHLFLFPLSKSFRKHGFFLSFWKRFIWSLFNFPGWGGGIWTGFGSGSGEFEHLYYYMTNFCNLIGLEQWYFSLIWNTYMWKLQPFCR